jgi:membrane fusion protein (multidrug efflux system)
MADRVRTDEQETRNGVGSREAEQIPQPPPRRKWRWIAVGIVLVAVLVGGWLYWRYTSVRESTDDAQIDGRLHAVSAKVSGRVIKLLVNDNQYVEAGTVLVQIDPRDYQVALDRALADLAEAEAKLRADQADVPIVSTTTSSQISGTRAGVGEAQAGVNTAARQVQAMTSRLGSAQALVREAQANSERAAKDLDRMRALVAKEEISRQQYDAAVAAAAASRAQLESAQAQAREAENGISVARSQLEQQRAKVARAESDASAAQTAPQQMAATRARAASSSARVMQMKAAVEQAQLNLQYTTVVAPASGTVSQRTVEVGQVVQVGQPLLAIVPLEDIWVTANFKENQLKKMRPGQPATIAVDAYGREYKGHVDSIAAATGARFSLLPPENATGNYVKVVQRIPVKIALEKGQDPEHLLRPGMSVVPTVRVE